jgi:DNA-binding NtrC family response regulator
VQLVADRFAVDDRGRSIDLASGAPVRLVWSSAGGVSEQAEWAARCARFAALTHPSIARLVDYGVCGEGRRIEAWCVSGVWRGVRLAAEQALDRANRYLTCEGLTQVGTAAESIGERDGRPVVVPDHGAGRPTPPSDDEGGDDRAGVASTSALGIVRETDPQVDATAELFGGQSASRVVAVSVWGGAASGVDRAVLALARTARLAGLVPVRADLLAGEIATVVRGRTLLIVARDQVDAGWSALLAAALEAPRPHMVLFAGSQSVPRVHAVPMRHASPEALVASVRPLVRAPAVARRVEAAARRAHGLPGRFEQLLWGLEPSPAAPAPAASRAAEQEAIYASVSDSEPASPKEVASSAWPVPADIARLRRQLTLAGKELARGRHAAGERNARQAVAALARRGAWSHAAEGALLLGTALAERGQAAAAESTATEARGWALRAREPQLLIAVGILLGRVLVDMGRLADAACVLEAVAASAASGRSPTRTAATLALARCFYWQGRYDEAWQRLQADTDTDASAEEAIGVATMRARLAVARARYIDAIAESARARDEARRIGDPGMLARACYATALAQLAAGDGTQAAAAATEAVRAARRARAPRVGVCAHLLRGEIARRAGASRIAASLVARFGRVPASRMPLVVRARIDLLRDALGGADATEAAERRAGATGLHALTQFAPRRPSVAAVAADDIAALLQCAHAAEEDATVLVAVCGRLRGRLRAGAVGFFVEEHGQFVQVAADGARIDAATVARVHTLGQLLLPHEGGERVEAGVPVRYAGRCIGVLAVRWPAGAAWDAGDVAMLLTTGAAAAGPALSGVVGRRAASAVARASDLLGVSQGIAAVRTAIDKAACAPFPVLVEGESGSGKELVARLLHRLGQRRDRPFCTVNCAALPDDLIESELFGHARGAFTGAVAERPGVFEEAHSGVLFLDEIGELSLRAQAKVLRAIQEGEVRRVGENSCRRVDVRLVAATNRDLRAEVAGGRFRLDLLYRLDVIRIPLPPLRERRDDIALLAEHFWRDAAGRLGSRATLSAGVIAALTRYDWPGNIRELQNVLASLAVRSPRRGVVPPSALPLPFAAQPDDHPVRLDEARRRFEQAFIRAALARAGGRRVRAAEELGVSRQGLAKLMTRLGLEEADMPAG